MSHPDYPLEATADLPGVAFGPMRQMILAHAQMAQLTVLEDVPHRLTVQTAHGLIGLRPGTDCETAGMVGAGDDRWLFVMKNAVVHQMRTAMPAVAEAMRWSNGDTAGSLPPNFQFVRVVDVRPVGTDFLRVTLEGEDLSGHGDDAIHFRLLQPPISVEPEWPSVRANGATHWPDGHGAAHRPVYTTRRVDHASNRLETDIFLHDGGRTTEWALEVQAGTRARKVVGLMGPSGGGLLDADRVFMATDETGFPAAARLVENLPTYAKGELWLESDTGADCEYPIEAPSGVSVHWLARGRGDSLVETALERFEAHTGATVWFAGEKEDARRLREAVRAAGWDRSAMRISGFWSASGG